MCTRKVLLSDHEYMTGPDGKRFAGSRRANAGSWHSLSAPVFFSISVGLPLLPMAATSVQYGTRPSAIAKALKIGRVGLSRAD
jgi:hypothetical protein